MKEKAKDMFFHEPMEKAKEIHFLVFEIKSRMSMD